MIGYIDIPRDKPYGWYFVLDHRPSTLEGPFIDQWAAERAAKKKIRRGLAGSSTEWSHGPLAHGDEEEAAATVAALPSLPSRVYARVGLGIDVQARRFSASE